MALGYLDEDQWVCFLLFLAIVLVVVGLVLS